VVTVMMPAAVVTAMPVMPAAVPALVVLAEASAAGAYSDGPRATAIGAVGADLPLGL
jgi:hypothetical protein